MKPMIYDESTIGMCPSSEAAKDSSKEINNQWLSTPKPSLDSFTKQSYIHGVCERRQVQHKLKLGEEGDLKETINDFKNQLNHFMKNVDSIIGKHCIYFLRYIAL
jgi:hypothetical protein